MQRHPRTKIAAAVALALIAAPNDLAWAQEAQAGSPPPADRKDDKQPRETINVNAERVTGFKARTTQIGAFRDAEILDVPMTINVVPRTVLDVQEAQGLFDALKNTAGVTRAQVNGTAADNLAIRGVQTENRTSFRLNGGLPVNNLVEMPLENKERVEALKGASALYYGFTSPVGVVNMVTKRAKTEPITSFTLSGNEFGGFAGHIDAGRTWGDNNEFGLRVNGVAGQVRNAIEEYRGARQLFAAAFDWRATDKLSFKADVEDVHRSAVEQASVTVLAPVNGVIAIPNLPDPTRLLSGTWAITSGNVINFQGRADYYFASDWSAMVEIGRAETNRERRAFGQMQNYNIATGQGTLRVGLTRGQSYINENQRTELAGRFFTGPLDHEFMLGYMRNDRYQNGPSQQVVNIPQNLYNPVVLNEPLLTANLTLSPQNIRDNGVYVFDRIRLFGDRVQVQVGARRTDYENISITGKYAVKDTTPAFGLLWKPRKDTSVYYSYIEGLEEGGTAPLTTNNPGQVLQPGVSKQHEVGVRTEAIAGLLLSGAYFKIERATAYTNSANFFVLDGRTEYKGFEYSATGEIGRSLSIYLSGMFLDAEQKNAQNAALIGKMPDNTPKQTHSAFVDYRPDFIPGAGVNFGAYYYSDRFVNNQEQGSIPGYTIYTLGGRYETRRFWGKHTTFQVYVENLADKRYWAGAGGGILAQGLPRTVKMSMKVDF